MKPKFCAITPTRGDRPKFDEHCKYLIKRQTLKPDHHFFIDFPPLNDEPDLTKRVRIGVQIAKDMGFESAYIIENDDYYPDNYFASMQLDEFDFIGQPQTHYYHLKTRRFYTEYHKMRASLFTTGFKIAAIEGFYWPDDKTVMLDLKLWEINCFQKFKTCIHSPLGIKHGIGLCGGSAHNENFPYKYYDPDLAWLKRFVQDKYSLNFYKSLMKNGLK